MYQLLNYISPYLTIANFILIFIYTVKAFSSGYLSEKGKNLATKEDIGQITDVVSKVKIEYDNHLEAYKAFLQKDLHTKNEVFDKTTEILLRYYDTVVNLLFESYFFKIENLTSKNTREEIILFENEIRQKHTLLISDFHKLTLYILGQKELYDSCAKVVECSLALRSEFFKFFGPYKQALLSNGDKVFSNSNTIPMDEFNAAADNITLTGNAYLDCLEIKKQNMHTAFITLTRVLNAYFLQNQITRQSND